MSAALLKKSLELCDTPFTATTEGRKTKISVLKTKQKDQRGVADVQKRNVNSVEQVKKKLEKRKSRAKRNLKKLNRLRNFTINEELAKKVLKATGKQEAEDVIRLTRKEESTVFTEEDFAQFEREYVDPDDEGGP